MAQYSLMTVPTAFVDSRWPSVQRR